MDFLQAGWHAIINSQSPTSNSIYENNSTNIFKEHKVARKLHPTSEHCISNNTRALIFTNASAKM